LLKKVLNLPRATKTAAIEDCFFLRYSLDYILWQTDKRVINKLRIWNNSTDANNIFLEELPPDEK